jgi:signal transduction histidine kinase
LLNPSERGIVKTVVLDVMMSLSFLKNHSWVAIGQSLGLLGCVTALDFFTGYDVAFFLFYLIPIIFTFKRLGPVHAVGMSILSISLWLLANTADGLAHFGFLSPVWGVVLRLTIFFLVVALLTVRRKLDRKADEFNRIITREKNARRRLEQEVLEASEREQRRIGHDLHDSLCQQLTASALASKVLANKLHAQSRPEADLANQLAGMIERAIELTRVLSHSLRPIEMKEDGLLDGFRELAKNINDNGHINCIFECSKVVTLATVDANMHLYRIAQEAINSAIRHGGAKNITILLKSIETHVILVITDDGKGLASESWIKDGLGRQIMNYRASLIDATLEVELLPQGGTRVTCCVPSADSAFDKLRAAENHSGVPQPEPHNFVGQYSTTR